MKTLGWILTLAGLAVMVATPFWVKATNDASFYAALNACTRSLGGFCPPTQDMSPALGIMFGLVMFGFGVVVLAIRRHKPLSA